MIVSRRINGEVVNMMKLSKTRISRGIWAYIFGIIALEPAAFQHFRITDMVFTMAQGVMLIIVVLLSCQQVRRNDFTNQRVCVLLVIYYTYFLAVTLLNGGRTKSLFVQAVHFIGFVLYLDIVLKNNPKELFNSFLNILIVFIIINCLMVFILENGLYETTYYTNNYLLGYDNQNINFILPALVLVLLKNDIYKKCKGQIVIIYTLAWITTIKVWSGMSIIVMALMTIVAIFCFRGSKSFFVKHLFTGKLFNLKNLFIVDIVANVALVYYRLQYYFEYLIVNVLHRNLTLTSRTLIWDRAINQIKKRPWFGYGREEYQFRALKNGFRANHPAGLHSHSRFLETLYSGGIIMLVLFLGIIYYAASRLNKVKDTTFAKILSFGIFIYLIGMLTEYYDYCIFFWGFLVIAENSEGILTKMKAEVLS